MPFINQNLANNLNFEIALSVIQAQREANLTIIQEWFE
jgi:hypothetical protein